MQPVTKFFFGLLLANILILNLIYVFSQGDSTRSLKTENVQGLFTKDNLVSKSQQAHKVGGSSQEKADGVKQQATVPEDQQKYSSKVSSKEARDEAAKTVETLINKIKKDKQELVSTIAQNRKSPYDFNPHKLLGGYETVPLSYYETSKLKKPDFESINYHIIHEADYCDKVDMFNLANPQNMFDEKNFFTDIVGIHPRTEVIDKIGHVVMRQRFNVFAQGKYHHSVQTAKYHLSVSINNFFTYYYGFHLKHEIGKDFNCATQMYNRIPGHEPMVRKDLSTDNLKAYIKSFGDKEECLPDGIFPKSYRLYDQAECTTFFTIINSEAYNNSLEKEPLQYLVKVGKDSHRSDGVFLLDGNKTKSINEAFDSGAKCGEKNDSLIAQAYVSNPLLLDMNNKFDFRVYMLIASTNPLIVYYHDGFLRVALSSYDKYSRERGTHLTNTHLAQKKFDEAKSGKLINDMNEEELKDYHLWSFEQLEEYLIETGKTTNRNWLEEKLRPAFREAFIHVVRMAKESLWTGSNVYQLFGLDFMLDDNLKLWFIEGNPNPQLGQGTEKASNIVNTMFRDLFEVQYAYYRSRMQRLKKIVEAVRAEYSSKKFVDYKQWSQKYAEAQKNRLESDFAIGKNNTWSLVMDLSRGGTAAYLETVPETCI